MKDTDKQEIKEVLKVALEDSIFTQKIAKLNFKDEIAINCEIQQKRIKNVLKLLEK